MKATINKHGVLEIEADGDMENYALRKWAEDSLLFNEDLGTMVVKGEYVHIKLEDD